MLLLRKVVFYCFAAVYCAVCPMTVAYALGYLYRPGPGEQIVQTGLIYVATAPAGADILLDGRPLELRTPAVIRNLEPGPYALEVRLPGRRVWSGRVPVERSKATVLEKILLLPRDVAEETLIARPFKEMIQLKDARFFLIGEDSRLSHAAVYHARDSKLVPAVRAGSAFADWQVLSWHSEPESACVLVRARSPRGERMLWIDAQPDEPAVRDVSDVFPEKSDFVAWDPRDRRRITAWSEGRLSILDLENGALYRNALTGVRGYAPYDHKIYAIDEARRLVRYDADGTEEEVLLDDTAVGETVFGGRGFMRPYFLAKDNVIFLGERGELYSNRLPYRFVESGVLGHEWDAAQKRLLVWTKDRIGVVDFAFERRGDGLFERGPRLVWVLRNGRRIERAFWAHEGSHILFQDETRVFVMDLETYGKPRLDDIIEVKKRSSIAYLEELGQLLYLGEADGRLRSIEIVPKKGLLPMPFPELREEIMRREIQEL